MYTNKSRLTQARDVRQLSNHPFPMTLNCWENSGKEIAKQAAVFTMI